MPRRVAITGAAGQLGHELVHVFSRLGDEVIGLHRPDFDITRKADLARLVGERLDAVINAAAWTDVDGCANDPERALQINGDAAGWVAEAADRAGAFTVQISTNEVFDGESERPYREGDNPLPVNPYGASKLAGERAVAAASARSLIVRTAWIYGGPRSFPVRIRAAADRARQARQPLRVVVDELGNPTPANVLAVRIAAVLDIATSRSGLRIVHLVGEPPVSRFEWADRILHDSVALEPIRQQDYPRPSRPPRRAILSTALATELGLAPIAWLDRPD
jgi:dTDP-4-dehydrorhamnose reductase